MVGTEAVLKLVEDGVIEVRPDGTIWKMRNMNAMPLDSPRRLETKTKHGYLAIRFYFQGKPYMLAAHRVVWRVLRGPIPPKMDINHKDGRKTNNNPENLELATRGENHLHAYRLGLRKKRNVAKDLSAAAKELRSKGLSYSKIGQALGVCGTTIFRAVRER